MMILKHKQHGFTLIELMVSMAIGLVVAIAAVQLFVTGFSTFNLQRGLGDVNENGRFAIDFMSKNLRVGEYSKSNSTKPSIVNNEPAIVTDVSQLPGSPSGMSSANNVTSLGIGSSDQLVVRVWIPASNTSERDCEGNTINVGTTGVYSVSRYFLRADSTASSASALACDAGTYADGAASMTGFGDNGVVLLSSVDNFQVLYGISANSTTTAPVRYVNSADYMALATPRPRIGAIRFSVLVRSSDGVGNLAVGSSTISGTILGGYSPTDNAITGASQDASDARILRRVFVSTVALRNVITPTP